MQVTYQKSDGCIIQRIRNTMLPYKIGDRTSMGWKVLNIEYLYKNKYYTEHQYIRMIHNKKQTCIKRKKAIELCTKEIIKLLYYILAISIINALRTLIGI